MIKRDLNITTSGRHVLLVMLCLSYPINATAETAAVELPAGVDFSGWKCKYCVFEEGYSGEIEAGIGTVSESSYKFGEYNGLYEDGPYLIGNATARYRDENAGYFDLRIRDLGLNTRSVELEGGRQGRYRVFLNYDEIPHYITDSAKTPYLGSGSDTLTLPAGWVNAGSTAGMTQLASSLQNVNLETERKRLGIGFSFIPVRHWETAVNFRHEVKDGQKATAGSFFFNSSQLVEPIDYVTDEVDVSVTYTTRKWQSKLTYYGSFFRNQNESLTWQNAYNPIVAGADNGQRALPPDNQFHQFLLSSGYQYSEDTRISGDIAIGRMTQDENLLAATINPNLSVTLPRSSANAQVNTLTANLNIDSRVNDKLRVRAAYRYNDRDNKTPSALFDWVTTDAFIATSRSNLPYSFTDNSLKLGGDYRLDKKTRLSGGYEYEIKERTNQEVDETREGTFWGKVSTRVRDKIDLSYKVSHSVRDASGYNLVVETDPAQNPLLRKYNMADRTQDTGSFHAGYMPNERVSIGLGIEYKLANYTESVVGLTESDDIGFNADASMQITEETSGHLFIGTQKIKSKQAGSQAFASPDWFATNDDTIDTFGIGVKHTLEEDRFDIGADLVLSRSTGKVRVDSGAPGADFPKLKANLDTLKLYANYRLKDNLTLHGAYWYEHYTTSDWMLDGVAPDTISSVISFGTVTPEYNVHAVMMSVRYRF